MKLTLRRIAKRDTYTIGKLFIDDDYFCDTLEDKDRNLTDDMLVPEITRVKIYAKTAIPTGTYDITLDVVSGKYCKRKFYMDNADGGRVPRLIDVKGFEGILIHCGNIAEDSAGCILVGENKVVGKVINSQATFKRLYPILKEANDKGEKITIQIL